MLTSIVAIAIPTLVFVTMVVVGMGLTTDDFRRVLRQPRLVAAATVGQLALLPAVALVLVRLLEVASYVEQGMLLVAACPAGTMANLYTSLARVNLAMSVTLSALSGLAAILTMPAAMGIYHSFLGEKLDFVAPTKELILTLLLTIMAPILLGMTIRRLRPDFTQRHQHAFFVLNLTALAVLLGLIIAQEAEHFARDLHEIALLATGMTGLALLAGYITGWFAQAGTADRFTVAMVFVVRNVGVATTTAVTVLGQFEFAVFATAYFLSQTVLLLTAVVVFRCFWSHEGPTTYGTDHP